MHDGKSSAGGRDERADIAGIARGNAVAVRGDCYDRGVGGLTAPSETQQHARSTTEPFVDTADVNGF